MYIDVACISCISAVSESLSVYDFPENFRTIHKT